MMSPRGWLCAVLVLIPAAALADDPLAVTAQRIMSGHAKEARPQVIEVRDRYAQQGNAAGEASAWLLLGMVDMAQHDAGAARADLQQATAKFATANDFFGGWLSLWVLAELEKNEGQYDEAIAVQERALALLQKAEDPSGTFSFETIKVLGTVFGAPMEGLGPLMDHPEIVKPFMLRFADVISRDGYGSALTEAGQFKKAEEQLNRAVSAGALFGSLFDPTVQSHLGDLRRYQWRLDDAAACYRKALDVVMMMPRLWGRDALAELDLIGKLAELDLFAGRVKEALTWNDRALKLARESSTPAREASVLEARGELLTKAGFFDEAMTTYQDALRIALNGGDLYRQASIESNIGSLHLFSGTYGSAMEHLQKSILFYQKLDNPYLEGVTWVLLAETAILLDAHDEAASALDTAGELAKKSKFKLAEAMVGMLKTGNRRMTGKATSGEMEGAIAAWLAVPEMKAIMLSKEGLQLMQTFNRFDGPELAATKLPFPEIPGVPFTKWGSRLIEGKLRYDRGDSEGARRIWQLALNEHPSRDHRAGFLAMIGASYWKDGRREEGIGYFARAAEALESSASDVKVEELLSSYLGSNRRLYFEMLIEMLAVQGRGLEAFAHAERARSRAFLNMVGNHRFNVELNADPGLVRETEILRTQIARREHDLGSASPDTAKRAAADLEHMRERYRSLVIRVKASNPEYAVMTNVEPLPIDAVRNELPEDVTLINYFVTPNAVHGWVVDRKNARYVTLASARTELQRLVCWANRFGPSTNSRGVKLVGPCDGVTAEEAFQALIAPFLNDIHTTKLRIVPHGVLHYIPFAALRNPQTNRYLIQDYTLTYVPSASALRFLRAKETPVDGGALVLGDPVTPIPSLAKLSGAAEEATAVAARMHTTAFLGAEARESLLYDLRGKYDLIHLAAHGIYDPANPLFSCIALARDDAQNGSLTVDEILSRIDLTGVNLVVLSACQTAVGARSGGDEVVGLTRALLYAGTPGVLSTLWNIDDHAAADLMREFYARLAAGASAADALREAQLAALSGPQNDPKIWAAFILNGDPQGRWKLAE